MPINETNWLEETSRLALEETGDPEFSKLFTSKIYNLTGGDPAFRSEQGVGIAFLKDNAPVDRLNPVDALRFQIGEDYELYKQSSGDPSSLVESFGGSEQDVAKLLEGSPDTGTDSFLGLTSNEGRFNQTVKSDDLGSFKSLLSDMVVEKSKDALNAI